jgi:hypothetical protein
VTLKCDRQQGKVCLIYGVNPCVLYEVYRVNRHRNAICNKVFVFSVSENYIELSFGESGLGKYIVIMYLGNE